MPGGILLRAVSALAVVVLVAPVSSRAQSIADVRAAQSGSRIRGYQLGVPRVSRSARGALEQYAFQPSIDGVPLLHGSVRHHVDRTGRTVRLFAPDLLAEPASRRFMVSESEALLLIRAALGVSSDTRAVAEQVYFVSTTVPIPAWRGYVESAQLGAYEVIIAAVDGAVQRITPLTHDAGASSGPAFRAPDVAHPMDGVRTVEPLTGWPTTEGSCPVELYPGVAAGECWTDGTATVGANADVCLDVNADNFCDARAAGSGGVFSSLFVDAYDQAGDPAPDRDAAMVNAFYWTNALHDWLYRLGFDDAAGNFESDDAVSVDVQDGAVINNATFSTPPDGIAPRMQLGLYPWSTRDSAFDGDIIVHEYVHGLTTRLVGGPSDVAALSIWQSGAMGEGWSDVLAASFTDDPVVGEYVGNNLTSGIRTAALDTSPYTFGRLGSLKGAIHSPTGRILPLPEVHADGEIWSAALWAVREQLGKDDFEQALVDALKLTPVRPSMLDARDAFIQAAGLLGVDGANECDVWSAFAAKGMGVSAALNPIELGQENDTALSVFESFDRPVECGGTPPTVLDNVMTEAAESDTGWQASGLWHRSTRRSSDGGLAWWFGSEPTGNYDTGTRAFGDLISPQIDLTGTAAAVLSWKQFFRGEGFDSRIDLGGVWAPFLNADSGRVWVSEDDGNNWLLVSHIVHDSPGSDFVSYSINLTRFAGSVIRVRFDFDSFTAANNAHEGWFLDEIRVDQISTDSPDPVVDIPVGGRWSFDGTFLDASGNGHALLASDADFGPGKSGAGLRFDGFNDGISVSGDELLSATSFTVSIWVRLLAMPEGWGAVISNYDGAFAGWYVGVLGDGRAFMGLASLPSNLPSVVSDTPLEVGEWAYLTSTYDGPTKRLSLYVNGALADTRTTPGFTPRTTGAMTIGKASWIESHHTAIDVDELAILTWAQSAEEVLIEFQGFTGEADATLAHWNFEETGTGPGTELLDVASGHTATTLANRTSAMSGIVGAARRFEGYPDHAVVDSHADFETESFSFSTWIRLDEKLPKWGVIFSTYDGVSQGWFLGLSGDRRPVLSVAGTPGVSPWLVALQSLELGRWYHLSVTFEGRDRRGVIYVDGTRATSAVFPSWSASVGVSPRLGRATWADAAILRCVLDEAKLYGFERTSSEIAQEHQLGSSRQVPQAVAQWGFEEVGNDLSEQSLELADSVTGLNATVLGSGSWRLAGAGSTSARRFPGAPNAAAVLADTLFSADAFSFSTWIYVHAVPSRWGTIFSNYDGNYRGWYLALNTDGRLIFSVSGEPSSNPWLLSVDPMSAGQWHHVAVTFDGVSRKGAVYLDGTISGTAVFPAWTPQQTVGPTFARASWTDSYYLAVTIDDATFYDVELSAAEIADLNTIP